MSDPNPVVAALIASGRRALAPIDPKDTAVSHADDTQPPIPAEGAPHAYVAVKRTHSVNADRPEWANNPHLIPAHETDELVYWNTRPGYTLLPIGPDGDTGTRAIVEPTETRSFVRYTETNDHEGENWTFWLQRDGNEEPLRWLADFLANVNAEELDPEYELFLDEAIPEEHVDVLTKWGGRAYMPLHNKVLGTMAIPEKFAPDDLYKGRIEKLFTAVSDGE